MKITIITPGFPYPKRGELTGIERYTENLALSLKKKGIDVKIVTTYWNGGKKYDYFHGIPMLRIRETKSIFGKIGSTFNLNFISFGLSLLFKKNLKFYRDSDILILALPIAFSRIFKFIGIPIISIFFHYKTINKYEDYLTLPFFKLLEKQQFKLHKKIITISNSSKNDIIYHYKLNENNINVIPIGIDTNKFNPRNKSKKLRDLFGENILLHSSLIVERKRVPILLKAMNYVIREMPDIQLLILGKGPLWNKCIELSKSLRLEKNVKFLGFVSDKELLKFYATSDLFVFPSEKEGFGQVLLEAMASGTPVICADKPPMSEIVGNGGLTFKLNDPEDFSKKIIYLLKNREELIKLKKNALLIAKNYNWNRIVEYYLNYIKLINKL